jgi:UPF0271 protein
MQCTSEEIVSLVVYQVGALSALCQSYAVEVKYLKPHGALYNSMMKDESIFRAIAKALSKFDKSLKLMILSSPKNTYYAKIAQKYHINLLYEVFADRAYDNEGFLLPRDKKGAVISNKNTVIKRVKLLLESGCIQSIEGKKLAIKADAICVHGDTKSALKLIKSLHKLQHDD